MVVNHHPGTCNSILNLKMTSMKYSVMAFILLLIACNREGTQPMEEPGVEALLSKYQLMRSKPEIDKTLSTMPIFSRLKDELDWSRVEMFVSNTGDKFVYIVGFTGSEEKKYAFTLSRGKNQRVIDEILVSRKMKDRSNGQIGILKNDEAIVINFQDGVRTIRELPHEELQLHFAREGFCQRQKNQTFKQCYNKEVDEFCDSFVSCVALATNPTVSVLIAVSCTCNAS